MAQRPKVSRIIILIVIIIIVCVSFYRAGQRCGWIPSKTQRLVAEITEDQMKLEIAPLEKRLSELKNEAKKRLLSEGEKKEIEKLKRKAENIRQHYKPGSLTKREAEDIRKNYKSGNLAKAETKIVDQEQIKQTKLEFEKLITGKPINTNWPIKDEWKQLITNKKIIVIYSKESLYTAVEIVQRLHSLGAAVSYNIASELSFNGQPGNIYYQFSDFDIATAIQATIVDIESFRLTSTGIRGQLLIWD